MSGVFSSQPRPRTAAKLHFYTKQCEAVTSDSQALPIVKCFNIPFRQNHYLTSPTVTINTQASELILIIARSTKTSTKGCNISDDFFQGRILQPTFLNSQERRHHAPCGRLKYIKHVCGKDLSSDRETSWQNSIYRFVSATHVLLNRSLVCQYILLISYIYIYINSKLSHLV